MDNRRKQEASITEHIRESSALGNRSFSLDFNLSETQGLEALRIVSTAVAHTFHVISATSPLTFRAVGTEMTPVTETSGCGICIPVPIGRSNPVAPRSWLDVVRTVETREVPDSHAGPVTRTISRAAYYNRFCNGFYVDPWQEKCAWWIKRAYRKKRTPVQRRKRKGLTLWTPNVGR